MTDTATTPAVPDQAAVPAVPEPAAPFEDIEGLEDVAMGDLVMPVIKIDHDTAEYVDELDQSSNATFDAVVLGIVKGRVLFTGEIGDGLPPACRSYDFDNGLIDTSGKADFPWAASGFAQADYPEGTPFPCDGCNLKEWKTDPAGKAPWCTEQITLVLLTEVNGKYTAPAVITFQRTALKPLRAYISSYAGKRQPMFTGITRFSLTAQQKGKRTYGVPKFERIGDTDPAEHDLWKVNYRSIRVTLTTPREFSSDDDTATEAETQVATPQTTTETASATAAAAGDDDMEF